LASEKRMKMTEPPLGMGSMARERVRVRYTSRGSGEARSRLFDISNASPKLTLVRPAELIAAME